MFPIWVYRNLDRYGNCAVSAKMIDDVEQALEDLKKHGFICKIRANIELQNPISDDTIPLKFKGKIISSIIEVLKYERFL